MDEFTMTKTKYYYWRDKNHVFKSTNPIIEEYEGLESSTKEEYDDALNITPKQAMRKLLLFSFNHSHDFIANCWVDDNHMRGHLEAKLKGYIGDANFTSPSVIMRFIADLDNTNMDKLWEYIIINNY